MTSYLENKLELLNANQKKLDMEKLAIEEQLILEIKKKSALEMDGTIVKFETQVNELKKYIDGNIMPNNIQLVLQQLNIDFMQEANESHKHQHSGQFPSIMKSIYTNFKKEEDSGQFSSSELESKRLIIRRQEICLRKELGYGLRRYNNNGYLVLSDDDKFITLEKFKDNLSKIDDITSKKGPRGVDPWDKKLVEIKPEIKIYDDIIPIFSTMIGIMKKQQEEIKILHKN